MQYKHQRRYPTAFAAPCAKYLDNHSTKLQHIRARKLRILFTRNNGRCQIRQEVPECLLLPTLLLPLVSRMREEVNHPVDSPIVRKYEENITLGIRNLRFLDRLYRLSQINCKDRVKEGLIWLATSLHIQRLEKHAAGANGSARLDGVWQMELYLGRDWEIRRGTYLCAVVADVGTHEYKGVWVGCRSRKAAEVTNVVARYIEKVKGAISKEVIGSEAASVQIIRETYLSQSSASMAMVGKRWMPSKMNEIDIGERT